MKTIKTKYLSFVRWVGKVPISLTMALVLVLVLVFAVIASDLPNYIVWDGQGSGSLDCSKMYEDEFRTPDGWMHWIVNQARNVTEAELVLGGSGSGTYEPEKYGPVVEFFTPYYELFDEDGERILEATFYYDGKLGNNSQFTLSDYCPGGEEDLAVEKTLFTSFTREHFWDITKKVETEKEVLEDGFPKIWLLGPGNEGDEAATWTIDVTYEGFEDSGWNVSGVITIENIGDFSAVITSVYDVLAGDPIVVDCGVTFPYTLPKNATLTCTYSEDVDGEIEGENEVSVTTERAVYEAEPVEIEWGEPDEEINDIVNIKDISDLFDEVDLGIATAPNDAQFTYTKEFKWVDFSNFCGYDYEYDNTATIVETDLSADAKLLVNIRCEELDVSKTVVTTYTREHFWEIAKRVETQKGDKLEDGTPKIWLYIDGSGDEAATWIIDVTYEGYVDSGFNVSGVITIVNTGDLPAAIATIDDVLGGTAIDVDCGVPIPYTLPVGATLTCTYDEDGYYEGENEVTVITLRDTYFADEEIIWGAPTTEINKTVTITDNGFELGQITAPDDEQFTYALAFAYGVQDYECGSYQIDNTATIVETGQYASATLKVNVQCFKYDSAWAKGDPNEPFCDNGFSNWGWTNPILPGEYNWPLWAGAAQCDTSKGTLVGSVKVVYGVDGYVIVTFNIDPGYLLGSTAVYAGYPMFPTTPEGSDTTAPGQYKNFSPFDGTEVYVIAHANVGMPDPDFGP